MSKSNVNPNHYKVAGRERQGEDIPQARNKQKHAESLVRRRAARRAATPQPPTPKAAVARGAGLVGTPDNPAQAADKRGKRSTAQKRAASRNDFGPMPATRAVVGAFGKEPSPRRRPARNT